MAGLLGAAVAVVPTIAAGASPPSTASFTAVDPYSFQASGGGNQVTIAQGGTVTFSYPSGSNTHNVDFYTGPQPTGCVQTSPTTNTSVPPLPNAPSGPGWSGTCTFNSPGTYTFYCDHHTFLMKGTIVVQGPSGTTTGTAPPTPGPTATQAPPTEPTGGGAPRSPLAGAAATAIAIASTERGNAVTGVVRISSAGAGGQLEIDLMAAPSALHARSARLTRVGRLIRRRLPAGTVRFSVPVNLRARRALGQRGQLVLTVVVLVRSPQGATASATRNVRLRSGKAK